MKTGIIASPSIASDELQKSTMGMSAKGVDIASYFLRDKIYSNKILACVREYICNAVDEHIKHNVDVPVDVSMTDVDGETIWKVRDYAKGLDEDSIRNVFGMYFESTKSNTNSMIGGFGIGSKAGHCYTDTFYVKSYFQGVYTLYACVLGGGSKGVPVGEIYKISEEPTNESGIEVSFSIKSHDRMTFSRTTRDFVISFGKPNMLTFVDDVGNTFIPSAPNHSVEKNGYTFNLYKGLGVLTASAMHIRMGGVIYRTLEQPMISTGVIVVDVPIGKLTIPISREYIEETTSNYNVLSDIKAAIKIIQKEEKESIPKITMGKFLTTSVDNRISLVWFSYRVQDIYPNESKFSWVIKRYAVPYKCLPSLDANGKLEIFIQHSVQTHTANLWLQRLHAHLQRPNGYYIIDDANKSKLIDDPSANHGVDFSDVVFTEIRKAGIPPIKKPAKDPNRIIRYAVYKDFKKVGDFTAEELEDLVAQKTGKKITKNWWTNANTFEELMQRTVVDKHSAGCWAGYYVHSKVMYEKLIAMGWLKKDSQEYRNQYAKIANEEAKRKRFEQAKYTVNSMFKTEINPRAIARLYKRPDLRDRFQKLLNKINNEDSTRARILTMVNAHYKILPRKDYRAILKLTNP